MLNTITRSLAAKKARLAEEEKGFTLIELLVVVIIIGILAAIAIPIFLGQQEQAKNSAIESSLNSGKTALIADSVENGFPADAAAANAILNDSESEGVTLTFTGSEAAFCILGDHAETTPTFAVDDTGGVIEGTCSATFVATPPAAPAP